MYISKERIYASLHKFFGINDFRPGQEEIIISILNGFDTLTVMPTGAGKSICYQLPALLLDGLTVVVTPLISLMKDQVKQLNSYGAFATHVDSTLEWTEVQNRIRSAIRGKFKLLYVAPERLQGARFKELLSSTKISFIAVDEAHCISQWGHDFRPSYLQIPSFAEFVKSPPLLALTATATPDVQDDIITQLKMRSPRVYVTGFARDNLHLQVLSESNRTNSITKFLSRQNEGGIIYAATRKSVDELFEILKARGFQVLRYHAGLTEAERSRAQHLFSESNAIMIATNAFGMGINKKNVRFVVHYEIPGSLESYFQEAGRAGRDGLPSECLLLFHERDVNVHKFFIETLYPPEEDFLRVYKHIFDSFQVPVGTRLNEYITISTAEIGKKLNLNSRTVDSVLRIMSQHNLIKIMPGNTGLGTVRSILDVSSVRRVIDRTSSIETKAVLDSLLRIYGSSIASAPHYIDFEELSKNTGISPSSIEKTLVILNRSGIINYKPVSDGTTFIMLKERLDEKTHPLNFKIIEQLKKNNELKLKQMVEYATTNQCRMNVILEYFGGDKLENGCGNCDNCLKERRFTSSGSVEKSIVMKILEMLMLANNTVDGNIILKLLKGSLTKRKTPEQLQKFYGILSEYPEDKIAGALDFLLRHDYIRKNTGLHPLLSLTQRGMTFLSKGYAPPQKKVAVFQKSLYRALREERRNLASEFKVPPFAICSEENLVQMSNLRPLTENEIMKFLPSTFSSNKKIVSRFLQVCIDFSYPEPVDLLPPLRRLYELYLEKLTMTEIAQALNLPVQTILDKFEELEKVGLTVNYKQLIRRDKFEKIAKELSIGTDVTEIRRKIADCEIAEINLTQKIISGGR
ncbi:MAG: RecQ family ATP-dependent DNA helicase [Candidatus Kryptoniota bacterium]